MCSSVGCIKSKKETISIGRLYWKALPLKQRIEKYNEQKPGRPVVLKSDVKLIVAKIKKNKAVGTHEIATEMLTALND